MSVKHFTVINNISYGSNNNTDVHYHGKTLPLLIISSWLLESIK